MAKIIKINAEDGSNIEFYDEIKAQGGMKDIYFAPSKKYVVAFFRKPLKDLSIGEKDRLQNIVGLYRKKIFVTNKDGNYWKNLFAWPEKIVEWNGKIGIVVPFYDKKFFFKGGPFDGQEKNGKWFASAKLRNRFLPADQKGTWLTHLHICIKIARAMRRLHAAGLAHSDLSYNNILIDPITGSACIIDADGLVVPGKYPPEVVGTPDFIAPEVMETKNLSLDDPNKKLPNRYTDLHALAVLIYMYLLYRHPLRGGKVWDLDPTKDEEMTMGEKALFIEHPTNTTNRPKIDQLSPSELPQGDINKLPYTICGPYLKKLFDRAFIDGLHDPQKRPSAQEWEDALVKTTDLIQPCQNPDCDYHWFVFDNTTKPRCPFCGNEYKGQLPILNFYYSPSHGKFISENYRLMVYDKQTLYMWHVNHYICANEKTSEEDKKPAGDFHFFNDQWILINRRLNNMYEILDDGSKIKINIGKFVPLTEGRKILLSDKNGGRLVIVQLVDN